MSYLLFLTSEDFFISNEKILCNNIPNFSLILFYSTQCVHCKNLIPIFKKLPNIIEGCQIGMLNVSTNKECIQMSKKTIAPIEYVPYIVLQVNGVPFMRYNGPHDMLEIRKFVVEVINKIQVKQKFTENVKTGKPIPEYCIGKPLCGKEEVCYLDFDKAYK